ncbi:MBL fold metallo-hydrolase [Streptomyces lancefieldiae]|uniref:MBL fold metallo-hydrolase n=1 Tax=Streptomyces lancefieldiae TaxID=3075520 RepID=A0ABU3ASU4_9ACTN|nr:MBL fold metallo-hydrolase [Streptomyces sp. DSM 40712]MDT0613256.1 MBL fold metallo-hydrolase [Streptomyces sp. DSM 40712]
MAAFADDALDVHFIGTATVLLRYGDLTLLTDPNFLHRGERAHLGYGLVSRRLTEPALDVAGLPPLDAVVLSHLHGDHWDRRARRLLDRSVPVVTTPHAARHLRTWQGFDRAGGLRTWESCTVARGGSQVRITSLPGRHSLQPVLSRLLPPVMGSMLELGPRDGAVHLRVYLSGDTLLYDGLDDIVRRFPDAELAVLHLGGTRLPGGFVVTMDGAQGAELARRLGHRRVLPVHYDDYSVFRSPLEDFLAEAGRQGLRERIVHCARGQHARVEPGSRPV